MNQEFLVKFVTVSATLLLAAASTVLPQVESVGSYDTAPDSAFGVFVSGQYAYVGVGLGGVRIIDISDPANPILASSFSTPSYVRDIHVTGGFAYVADRYGGLIILDVTDPANPTLAGSCPTPDKSGDVYVTGGIAYIADSDADLQIVDVSDCSNPTLIGSLTAPGFGDGVYVLGDYAYLARYSDGLWIVNITDPHNPFLSGWYHNLSGHDVHVSSDYAYVGARGGGLQIIDVSNPSNPVWVSSYPTPGTARGVFVASNYAYVTDASLGLHVVDVTDPARPVLAGSYDTPGHGFDVHVSGQYIYVADRDGGLQILHFVTKQHVHLDIKPGSCPNPLNVKSARFGGGGPEDNVPDEQIIAVGKISPVQDGDRGPVLPCAILGAADFDVSEIDPATVRLEGVPLLRWTYEDVATPIGEEAEECECNSDGPDGYTDMTIKYDQDAIIAALGEVNVGEIIPLTISGELIDGTPFEGVDCVVIRGGKPPKEDQAGSSIEPVATLIGNSPNPFNPITEISFSLPEAAETKLEIFNIVGQLVAIPVDGYCDAGLHAVTWDAGELASGVYLYRLTTDTHVSKRKMMLLK